MHCSARDKLTDDDRLLISWSRKDGVPLAFNRHSLEGGNLTIENLNADDRGECMRLLIIEVIFFTMFIY